MKNVIILILLGLFSFNLVYGKDAFYFNEDAIMKELAIKNNIKPSKLLHELSLISIKGNTKVRDIFLTKIQFGKLYQGATSP